jgi:hypothetical protein
MPSSCANASALPPSWPSAKKHNVSTDWLLCGDLKGLQRMMLDRKDRDRGRPTQKERIMAKYHALTPDQQRIVDEFAARVLAEREAKEPEPA